ncbi:oligosaccharyl transferase [Cyclospora cayetanensis]|uniref:dolichyl-diphosphooligosaccharide--protein glycotransferase n=1 Tax=Cyclospora cayetanensis TaxID=88456 RepID=A0A1D3D9K6_9EIME|nr:oligosaccharyl transferase [Cyclospora cayetanensis]
MAGKRWSTTLEVICLFQIVLMCLFIRLFPAIRGESTVYDFDPYFNHRATKYLAKEGFTEFWNWYDDCEYSTIPLSIPAEGATQKYRVNASWYPLGRPVGQTLFPGLMTTSYVFYRVLRLLGVVVRVSTVSSFLPPAFSCLNALIAHCFAKHASGSRSAGLFAALFAGISPAYVKTSLVGSYDNECVAIFAMLSGFYQWTRAIKSGSMFSAFLTAIPSAYMATAWGGYVFLLNAIAVHMVALTVLGSATPRHHVAYIVFYITMTALCINVPFLNFTALWSSEHMASHGVFLFVVALGVSQFASRLIPATAVKDLRKWVAGLTAALLVIAVGALALTGKTAWSSRSLTLLDPTYATKYVPIIASVSEHQPTTWASYFLDLHMNIFLAPLGLIIALQRGGGSFFIGLYGVLACYFSGGPIGRTNMPKPDDFHEAYHWFRQNTHPKAKIMSWWDYGYQLSEVGNRTVLVDNNTWNSTHIATVGLAFASEESEAYNIAQDLDVDYIFVVFGGLARFASDDLNKLLWMVRIASGVFPRIQQSNFLGPRGQFTVGSEAPSSLKRSLMYKLSYHRFSQATKGFDFARKVQIDSTAIRLKHFEEVYTTENWVVRIYKVRKRADRDTKMHNAIESAL